jgi:CRISPR-associated endonuclease/helicase Cas3
MRNELYSHPGKPLLQHLAAVAATAEAVVQAIPWEDRALGTTIQEIARILGLYHDVGKGTTYFQDYLAWNVARETGESRPPLGFCESLKNHAMLSALATFFALDGYLPTAPWGTSEQHKLLAAIGFYAVRQHHQNLQDDIQNALSVEDSRHTLHDQIEHLDAAYFSGLPWWSQVATRLQDPNLWNQDGEVVPLLESSDDLLAWQPADASDPTFFIVALALFSALLEGDKLDASGTGLPARREVKLDGVNSFRAAQFGPPIEPIDLLRDWAYQTAVNDGRISCGHHICALSLPTGSGKTLAALGWALALREELARERQTPPRIIYALPFISIVDQNYDVFKKALTVESQEPSSDVLLEHTHLSEATYKVDDEDACVRTGNQQELLVEGWESEVIVTTFVQLFETIFSGNNRMTRRFTHLAGSIIILDEVQAYPPEYWGLFQKVAETLGRLTGTYFLLCTATQPLIFDAPHEVVPTPCPVHLAAPRTRISWEAREPMSLEEFTSRVIEDHHSHPGRTLVVLNTIGCAEKVLRRIQDEEAGAQEVFLSSYVCPADRMERIHSLRDGQPEDCYVVTTQLIEAGVDIDCNTAWRDLAPLDSLIQVTGRVNRSDRRNTEPITVVSLQNDNGRQYSSFIYGDLLLHATRAVFEQRSDTVEETDYSALATAYYAAVKAGKSNDKAKTALERFSSLDLTACGTVPLIKEDQPRASVFVERNPRASAVLAAYQQCRTLRNPWERHARWVAIKAGFLEFVINVPLRLLNETGLPQLEESEFFYLLPADQLVQFYRGDTGFTAGDSATRIW